MKIRLFEMFAGYGGASFALKKAGIDFETVGYSEIDKFAVQCYEQNHWNEELLRRRNWPNKIWKQNIPNYDDCTKINPEDIPDFDLLTGGFPCQAFSVAGKGLGEQDTRGTLFHDIIRIAEAKKPKYMLLENVKGLTNKRHKATFEKILSELDRIGYVVSWKVLNSKEYGIPQNRERVFFVCFRKDIPHSFEWPEKEELQLFLKDILEPEVEQKYYLSEKQMEKLILNGNWNCNPSGKGMNGKIHRGNIAPTVTTNKGEGAKIVQLNNPKHSSQRVYSPEGIACTISAGNRGGGKSPCKILQLNKPYHSNDRVYSEEGISPTLNTMGGGNRQPFIQIKNATAKGYLEAREGDGVSLEQPNSKTRRGRVQIQSISTLQCNDARGVVLSDLTIRKLTPTECFRLMGFLNDEINLVCLSDTQRYKLAGNGWEINVVSKIFEQMFILKSPSVKSEDSFIKDGGK